ncbi:HAD-IB family hydrolase [Glutamicibacter mishrai]|uniref:HAD family hydrolase n=1 Tax=Glutamicibacter mishrai TaxID=1775880 RepID=UPI0020CD5162|nr:HAD-IB family hydrolase [Glutamicibacter mishrai]UTT40444.1 HAD-IB family hydrolase [Glutamicibacter mishrai]
MQNAAYFDVDGTITPLNTLFSLLRFDAQEQDQVQDGERFLQDLFHLKTKGAPREITNRQYFQWWAERDEQEIIDLGKRWFDQQLRHYKDGIIFPPVRSRLYAHEMKRDRIVLVSGSFLPALLPIASYIGAKEIIATSPMSVNGQFTGEVEVPMIGANKAKAVMRHASMHSLLLSASYGYGDDLSDTPFMSLTGHPTAICFNSEESELSIFAKEAGWDQIQVLEEL